MNLLLVSSWLVISEDGSLKYLRYPNFDNFLSKLGTKVKQCAKVSSVFDYFWIFDGPDKIWPKRRRRPFMPRGWIFQKWHHIHDKTTHWDAENHFCKKSWGCYHVAVVQNCPSFRRFDRQLTRHKWMLRRVSDSTSCSSVHQRSPRTHPGWWGLLKIIIFGTSFTKNTVFALKNEKYIFFRT